MGVGERRRDREEISYAACSGIEHAGLGRAVRNSGMRARAARTRVMELVGVPVWDGVWVGVRVGVTVAVSEIDAVLVALVVGTGVLVREGVGDVIVPVMVRVGERDGV